MLLRGRTSSARALGVALTLAVALAGCSGPPTDHAARAAAESLATAPPRELAQRLADLEVAMRAITPVCSTFVGGTFHGFEICVYRDGEHLLAYRSHGVDSVGTEVELSCWYQDDRPWVVRSVIRKRRPAREAHWRVATDETYFDPGGQVVWAGFQRDGRRFEPTHSAGARLVQNDLRVARSALEQARQLFPPAAGAAGPRSLSRRRSAP